MIKTDEIVVQSSDREVVKRLKLGSNGKVVLTDVSDEAFVTVLNMSNARRITTGTWKKRINSTVEHTLFTVTVHWDDDDAVMFSCIDHFFQRRLVTALVAQLGA